MTILHTPEEVRAAKVGDTCYVKTSFSRHLATIVSISPTQRFTVKVNAETTRVFKIAQYCGRVTLVCKSEFRSSDDHLELDMAKVAAEVDDDKRRRAAAAAMDAVACPSGVRHTWSKESMQEHVAHLEALVAAARVAVEAV